VAIRDTLPSGKPHPPLFSDGELVAGRYRVLRFVDRGGMGEIYAAEDQLVGETIAIKTLRPELAADTRALQRFRRELQLARRVAHPNVCRLFDLAQHEIETTTFGMAVRSSTWLLTMELLEGRTLQARIAADGALSPGDARPIVTQVVGALAALHGLGIVHRDIKSSNIMLTEGRTVVTDFGLARSRSQTAITTSPSILGSPHYMAPEQVEGAEATFASDLYSLGVVLYEMVCGVLPFVADTALETAALRLRAATPRPRTRQPELDPRWDEAIVRCLQRKPEDRFASVEELLSVL
jgi:serine/threonine protein kinase